MGGNVSENCLERTQVKGDNRKEKIKSFSHKNWTVSEHIYFQL